MLGRVNAFWIVALALLLSLSWNDWRGQGVDAVLYDPSISVSSRYNRNRRYTELEYKPQRRRRQLPWLLPLHSIHNNKSETKTALLWKLRGGSNKSEVEDPATTTAADTKKDKRRNDKSKKKKDKRKRKNKKQIVEDETNESEADDDIPIENEAKTTAEEDEYASKLFLVDPFRMNEIARYEASIAQDSEGENDAASDDAASESETEEIVEEEVANNKRRNKKDKKKEDRKRKATDEVVEDESSVVAEEPEIVQDKKDNRKNKRNRKRNNRKQAEADIEVEDDNTSASTIESASETSEEEGEIDAADTDASEQSSPFWFVDVWTQQLSDPEEMIEELEETETSTESDSVANVSEDDTIDTIPNENDAKRGNEKQSPAPIEEELETPAAPDSNTSSIDIVDENDANVTTLSENETEAVVAMDQNTSSTTVLETTLEAPKSYVSTGAWVLIDNMLTIGLASKFKPLRLSTKLRLVRKLSARVTRMHGLLSGKPRLITSDETTTNLTATAENVTDSEDMEVIQKRLAAIEQAREGVERAQAEERAKKGKRNFWGFRVRDDVSDLYLDSNETNAQGDALSISESEDSEDVEEEPKIPPKTPEEIEAEFQRMERVREIDQLIVEGQNRLAELICEKDVLQRRPNPLFNYTTTETTVTVEEIEKDATAENATESEKNATQKIEIQASRQMNFPPDDLVAEYLDMMISTRRLVKMNHTDLWQESEDEVQEGEEESIGDDLFTASANVHRLYQGSPSLSKNGNGVAKNGKKGGGGGSWLLRQRIGGPRSLGEKIGELVETLAYKAVTASLMSFLARMISGLHGTNVLKHSDIRLFLESSPDLPPIPKDGIIRGNHESYAEETLKTVMRRKTRRSKKRSQASFVQQEAVTETLLSHVQISAPLLKLFPLAWQRALLGNIIGLSCAIISDFMDGLHFQILGHQLSFAFRPITEVDMARHLEMAGGRFNQRRYKAAEFEAAIQATAEDLKEELKFLDSWHERALGSGVLRTQVANLIARIVLTLTDEVLSGARMDLWSTQAGGPRMLAGLEHRLEEDGDEGEQL